jgi:hypothetical protein
MSDYDDAFGPWLKIVQIGATLGLGLAGLPAAGAGVDLVVALVGIEDGQTRLLRTIKNDTRLLREGDFATAKLMLKEANRVGPSDSRYLAFLEKSADLLYAAHGLAESVQEQSIIEFQLALVWYSLQSEKDGNHWIEQSAMTSDRALNQLVDSMQELPARLVLQLIDERQRTGNESGSDDESNNSALISARWVAPAAAGLLLTNPAASVVVFAGVGVAAQYRKIQRARLSKLKEYLQFYNSVEALNARAQLRTPPSPLVVLSTDEIAAGETEIDADTGEHWATNLLIKSLQSKFTLTRRDR